MNTRAAGLGVVHVPVTPGRLLEAAAGRRGGVRDEAAVGDCGMGPLLRDRAGGGGTGAAVGDCGVGPLMRDRAGGWLPTVGATGGGRGAGTAGGAVPCGTGGSRSSEAAGRLELRWVRSVGVTCVTCRAAPPRGGAAGKGSGCATVTGVCTIGVPAAGRLGARERAHISGDGMGPSKKKPAPSSAG